MTGTELSSGDGITLYRRPFTEGASGSRALLVRTAQLHTGWKEEFFSHVETNPWGKPFFPDAPQLHFSISHSGDWWICAMSHQPVGLDLQLHQTYADPAKLAQRFFHPRENSWLAEMGYSHFFDLWSAKESWEKYMGRGFYLDPGDFSLVSPEGQFPLPPQGQCKLLPCLPGYSLCLCAQQIGAIHMEPWIE